MLSLSRHWLIAWLITIALFHCKVKFRKADIGLQVLLLKSYSICDQLSKVSTRCCFKSSKSNIHCQGSVIYRSKSKSRVECYDEVWLTSCDEALHALCAGALHPTVETSLFSNLRVYKNIKYAGDRECIYVCVCQTISESWEVWQSYYKNKMVQLFASDDSCEHCQHYPSTHNQRKLFLTTYLLPSANSNYQFSYNFATQLRSQQSVCYLPLYRQQYYWQCVPAVFKTLFKTQALLSNLLRSSVQSISPATDNKIKKL